MSSKKRHLVWAFLAMFACDVSASFGETEVSHSNHLSNGQSHLQHQQRSAHSTGATMQLKHSNAHPQQAATDTSTRVTKESALEAAEDKAISLVEKSKEVRAWEKQFGPTGVSPSTNGKPAFDVESHHGSIYVVHVFEDKPEQALTFARYEVNIKTGRITKVD